MKKLFTLIGLTAFTAAAMAQNARTGGAMNYGVSNTSIQAMPVSADKAAGDTLFWFDSQFFFIQSVDSAAFNIVTEDLDGFVTYGNPNWTDADFAFFFSLDPTDLMPNDIDTAFFMAATSWFTPPGQADNWFEFGPVTIPAAGASVVWKVRNNPAYRDGYEVLASTTGMDNYTDFSDVIYSRTDANPSPTDATDTIWGVVSAPVPAMYYGQPTYFAIHHNANDMDVIYFDDIMVIEGSNLGVEEGQVVKSVTNFPNPVIDFTTVAFELASTQDVKVTIFNLDGKVIYTSVRENMNAGAHNIQLDASSYAAGNYIYTISAGNTVLKGNMVVVK